MIQRIVILYDADCGLCTWTRRWMSRQPAFLDVVFVPAGSERARQMFPSIERFAGPDDLVVVSDEGGVYRGPDAWILCLYALVDFREWSERLASPILRPLARKAFAMLSEGRSGISRWLSLRSESELAAILERSTGSACPRIPTRGQILAARREPHRGIDRGAASDPDRPGPVR